MNSAPNPRPTIATRISWLLAMTGHPFGSPAGVLRNSLQDSRRGNERQAPAPRRNDQSRGLPTRMAKRYDALTRTLLEKHPADWLPPLPRGPRARVRAR